MSELTAEWLRKSCPQIWDSLHDHPFLREMATGTLSLDRFRFYLEQDTMYLREYAKCMALGAARADRVDEVAWLRDSLDNIVDNESSTSGRPTVVGRGGWRRPRWRTRPS